MDFEAATYMRKEFSNVCVELPLKVRRLLVRILKEWVRKYQRILPCRQKDNEKVPNLARYLQVSDHSFDCINAWFQP